MKISKKLVLMTLLASIAGTFEQPLHTRGVPGTDIWVWSEKQKKIDVQELADFPQLKQQVEQLIKENQQLKQENEQLKNNQITVTK